MCVTGAQLFIDHTIVYHDYSNKYWCVYQVHGSSLISQLWSPKMPVSTDDGYSSPKSEKDTDGAEDDDDPDLNLEQNDIVEIKKQSELM